MDEVRFPFDSAPPQMPIEEKRIGFGKRLGAWLLDLIIVILIAVIVNMLLAEQLQGLFQSIIDAKMAEIPQNTGEMPDFAKSMIDYGVRFGILLGGVGFLYSFLELFTGASPAKMMLGIVVAHADARKGNIGVWAIRWAIKEISSICNFIGTMFIISSLETLGGILGFAFVIGCFFALSSKKQALHDIIAKTAVYDTDDVLNS
ncbi:MAG: RDD family protein [Candidatus Kapabacteria bacterium]|nr:RDD family protein [Candidatus Kapabacteria bacterium]